MKKDEPAAQPALDVNAEPASTSGAKGAAAAEPAQGGAGGTGGFAQSHALGAKAAQQSCFVGKKAESGTLTKKSKEKTSTTTEEKVVTVEEKKEEKKIETPKDSKFTVIMY